MLGRGRMRTSAETIILNVSLVNVVGFLQRISAYIYRTIFKTHILWFKRLNLIYIWNIQVSCHTCFLSFWCNGKSFVFFPPSKLLMFNYLSSLYWYFLVFINYMRAELYSFYWYKCVSGSLIWPHVSQPPRLSSYSFTIQVCYRSYIVRV